MLNYEISGKGTEVLVLLHGFMESVMIWEDLEKSLSQRFKLLKIDLPGHGMSRIYGEIHTMELMAGKVKEVLDKLGMSGVHLMGHSMGGYVALAFADKYASYLKSLTLFFSTYFADDEEKKQQRRRSFRIIQENFKAYIEAGVPLLFNPYERDELEERIDQAKTIAKNTAPEGVLACVKGMIERTDKRYVLEQLDVKILVIAGKHDQAVKTGELVQGLPQKANIKSYILDCGHNGHWEKPEICATIINEELLPK